MIGWPTWILDRKLNILLPVEIKYMTFAIGTEVRVENGPGIPPENIVGEVWFDDDGMCNFRIKDAIVEYKLTLAEFESQFDSEN